MPLLLVACLKLTLKNFIPAYDVVGGLGNMMVASQDDWLGSTPVDSVKVRAVVSILTST